MRNRIEELETELAQMRALVHFATATARVFAQPERFSCSESYLVALTAALRKQARMAGLEAPLDIPAVFETRGTPPTERQKMLLESAARWSA